MKKIILILLSIFALTSCGTIVNDANVPVSLSFSDGSDGKCKLNNKRASYSVSIPSTTMIRRSDDALRYDCTADDGRKAFGSINSSIDAAKAGASVIFFDLGITDAITDKGRDYPTGFVIPLKKKSGS